MADLVGVGRVTIKSEHLSTKKVKLRFADDEVGKGSLVSEDSLSRGRAWGGLFPGRWGGSVVLSLVARKARQIWYGRGRSDRIVERGESLKQAAETLRVGVVPGVVER